MSALFEVTNTGATTSNFYCVGCGKLIAAEPWRGKRTVRTWDTDAAGQPKWDSPHVCKPATESIS